jgi:mRNA interferase RelE/StbE
MNVNFSNKAKKQFHRLDESAKSQILMGMQKLEKKPPEGDIKKITGGPADYRLRLGDYRIFFNKLGNNVVVERIFTTRTCV